MSVPSLADRSRGAYGSIVGTCRAQTRQMSALGWPAQLGWGNLPGVKQLLLRLSAIDAGAENALRVISFFDELTAQRVPLRTLVRQTAKLAECPAGVLDAALGLSLRAEPNGQVGPGLCATDALSRELSAGSQVWLERDSEPLALDDILLERFAIAAALLLDHARGPLWEGGEAAAVKLSLSTDASEGQRSQALRHLGFDVGDHLCVLAVATHEKPSDIVAALGLPRSGVRSTMIGSAHAVLARPYLLKALTAAPGIRVGIGPELPGVEAPYSWHSARLALRFAPVAGPGPAVVHASDLGAMAIIAERMSREDISRVKDVQALDSLAAEPTGADTLAVLAALCQTGSARKAASSLYRHHSTLITRLAHAERQLGFAFGTPTGRLRLELALMLRQLRLTAE